MTLVELVGSAIGGAGLKSGFDYLRTRATLAARTTTATAQAAVARVRVEATADLTLNERLWARIAKLEERLDAERDECDTRIEGIRREAVTQVEGLHAQIADLQATCDRQEREITDLRKDKDALVRASRALEREMAEMRREGGR